MIGDIYRLTIEAQFTDAPITVNNVIWFREVSDHGSVGDEQLANDFGANITLSGQLSWCHTSFVWQSVTCQRMYPARGVPQFRTITPARTGGWAGNPSAPPVACMVLRIASTRAGRSGEGRLYLGGFHAGAFGSTGQWFATAVTAVQGSWNAVLARYSETNPSIQWRWGVWSKQIAGRTAPFDPSAFAPVFSTLIDPVVRVQRSREYGVSRRHAGRH